MLFKFLHFCPVFNVDRENSASGVADEQLAVSVVEADASYVSGCEFSKDGDEAAGCGVPDFDAFWVGGYEGVEDWVVEYADAGLVVCKVVVGWFIVVIKYQSSTSRNNPLWIVGQSKTINFVKRTIKCLNSCKCSHVPHSKHTRYICRYYLMSSRKNLHPY